MHPVDFGCLSGVLLSGLLGRANFPVLPLPISFMFPRGFKFVTHRTRSPFEFSVYYPPSLGLSPWPVGSAGFRYPVII